MGLSRREKVFIMLLLLTIGVYLYYNYLYMPKYNEYLSVREDLENKKLLEMKIKKGIRGNDKIKTTLNNLKIRAKEVDEIIPSGIYQEEIILLLKRIFENNNVNIISINFSLPKKEQSEKDIEPSIYQMLEEYEKMIEGKADIDISKYGFLKDNKTDKESTENKTGVEYLNANINFSGYYKDFKNALLEIEEIKRKIIIKNISLTKSENGIIGSMSLQFPYYPAEKDDKKLIWEIHNEYGNKEPFDSNILTNVNKNYSDINIGKIDNGDSNRIPVDSDFYVIVKPITSDMPTVTMGKSPYRHTTIYVDNPDFETVNFYIREENDRLVYRYENSMFSYPNNEEFVEFVPNGDKIILKIYSQPRLHVDDNSGVILNVKNETEVELDIFIYDDDKNNPRIKINPERGLVKIFNASI